MTTCQWPIGDPRGKGFHFCDEPRNAGYPYCLDHCRVAYQKIKPRHEVVSSGVPEFYAVRKDSINSTVPRTLAAATCALISAEDSTVDVLKHAKQEVTPQVGAS